MKSDAHDDSGQSYRATFNRMFTDTQTSIVLAAYRYSTKGYYNLNDALYRRSGKIVAATTTLWRQKRHDLHGEPEPAGRLGRFYLGRISDSLNRSGTEKQYQVSYNNSFGRLPGRERAARLPPDSSGHRRDDRFTQLQLPLWFGDNRTANLTSTPRSITRLPARRLVSTVRWTTSENNLNYGVSTTTATGGQHDVALSLATVRHGPPSTAATARRRLSSERHWRQRTMIAHSGGVVLTGKRLDDGLIESQRCGRRDASGIAGHPCGQQWCAILPYLRPYRINAVEIDPKAAMTTWPSIAPWRRLCRGKAAWLRSRSALGAEQPHPAGARRTTSRCRLRQVFSPRRQESALSARAA